MEDCTPEIAESPGEDRGEPEAGARNRYGRRALVVGAAAGAGAAISAMAGSSPAGAADGDNLIVGQSNSAADTTSLSTTLGDGLMATTTQTGQSGVEGEDQSSGGGQGVRGSSTAGYGVYGISTDGTGVYGEAQANDQYGVYGTAADGTGVYGISTTGTGVDGESTDGYGVYGSGDTGVFGIGPTYGVSGSGSTGVIGNGTAIGVQGRADGAGSIIGVSALLTNPTNTSAALQAQTAGTGSAVEASIDNTSNASPALSATTNGTGAAISASTTGTGPALAVDGVATFSRSGIATVAGTSSRSADKIKVTGVALTSSSLVLATPQDYVAGVAVAAVVPKVSSSSFDIYLTEAVEVSLDVAWFVIG